MPAKYLSSGSKVRITNTAFGQAMFIDGVPVRGLRAFSRQTRAGEVTTLTIEIMPSAIEEEAFSDVTPLDAGEVRRFEKTESQ